MGYPDVEDYIHCFEIYGEEIKTIYLDHEDGKYEFLFERILRLLIQSSPFNLEIPAPFRITAKKYLSGDPETRAYMNNPEKRNFMLSDLYDFVVLQQRIRQRKL